MENIRTRDFVALGAALFGLLSYSRNVAESDGVLAVAVDASIAAGVNVAIVYLVAFVVDKVRAGRN